MTQASNRSPRRGDSLTRDRIVQAAIELLDSSGEGGLTFRALAQRLATGAGAIYGHVADKNDLLVAACDAVVARTLDAAGAAASPQAAIRALALGMFDAMDIHPWVGSALMLAAGRLPMVRLFERIGQQVQALGVPDEAQWSAASALIHYVLGVGGQNASNAQFAQALELDRSTFLEEVAAAWSRLDPTEFPFTRSVAAQLSAHDDRLDFLAGIDLILAGLQARARRTRGGEPPASTAAGSRADS